MLKQIDLKHFKCFEDLQLPLCPLTLLSGANASGKSSVLQALALLHQTMREHEWSSRLMLNGATVCLGSVGDVFNGHGDEGIEIGLLADEGHCQWEFAVGDKDGMSMEVREVFGKVFGETDDGANAEKTVSPWSATEWNASRPFRLQHLLPTPNPGEESRLEKVTLMAKRLRELNYLTAERMGPRETYPLDDPDATLVVGPRGEHAASLLHAARNLRRPIGLEGLRIEHDPDIPVGHPRYPQAFSTGFRDQTEGQMRRFFPGCGLSIEQAFGSDVGKISTVALGLRTSSATNFHSPIHTGFGLTQVFPIVVAALSLDKGGLLLVENPEVHLHPAGQAQMGGFLAEVAAAGAQVILETHSDHVLNGIRRAVKNKVLTEDKVALHFFQAEQGNGPPQFESPKLDADGNVDSWPDGFFDQFEKDMHHFIGWD